MSEFDKTIPAATENPVASPETPPHSTDTTTSAEQRKHACRENRRWWIKLFVQPVLLLACGAILIIGLGVAQRWGFISAGGSGGHSGAAAPAADTRYICPMMCTPPQAEPGRCPVCAMQLVPATSGGGDTDSRSVHIDPAARRVANIRTVAVTSMPVTRTIRAIGELSYDEGTLKTISAYVDGRLERLYADYTGVVVRKGDQLALLYSPQLFSSQVGLLLAKQTHNKSLSATLPGVVQSNHDLYLSARQRLVEMGMTEPQIEQLEQGGEASSRLHLHAPISGTVIEKLAVEGQYVTEGQAVYRLADLSTVWLMLKLFPDEAATIRYGQKVLAEIQSLPGRKFTGRVAFIDPSVDPVTRTVGVRVVLPNQDGLLRVGDYATATMDVPLSDSPQTPVYDPELANKWISPRHPHVIAEAAGACPICGVELVPAAQFGFTDQPAASSEALVVPRDAVLRAGNNSVLYVETEPGRFEIRRVVLGPTCGDQVVIRSGVALGERVATRGNFLIDSQMQLAGNPSLIDPTRLQTIAEEAISPQMMASLADLSPADRALVERQRICPVGQLRLGSMGTPRKVDVNGTPVFICCEGCRERLLTEPDKYLAKLAAMPTEEPAHGSSPATSPQWILPPIGVPRMIEPNEAEPEAVKEATEDGRSAEPQAKRVAEAPQEAGR